MGHTLFVDVCLVWPQSRVLDYFAERSDIVAQIFFVLFRRAECDVEAYRFETLLNVRKRQRAPEFFVYELAYGDRYASGRDQPLCAVAAPIGQGLRKGRYIRQQLRALRERQSLQFAVLDQEIGRAHV